jgi:hypothetical protein
MVLRRDDAQGYGKAMLRVLKHPTTLLNECVLRRGKTSRLMSALGQKRTLKCLQPIPQKQTLELILEMSALCQKRTHALQQSVAGMGLLMWPQLAAQREPAG